MLAFNHSITVVIIPIMKISFAASYFQIIPIVKLSFAASYFLIPGVEKLNGDARKNCAQKSNRWHKRLDVLKLKGRQDITTHHQRTPHQQARQGVPENRKIRLQAEASCSWPVLRRRQQGRQENMPRRKRSSAEQSSVDSIWMAVIMRKVNHGHDLPESVPCRKDILCHWFEGREKRRDVWVLEGWSTITELFWKSEQRSEVGGWGKCLFGLKMSDTG